MPCGPNKGVDVFKCCDFTTKRSIHVYVLIVTLDSTHNGVKV